MGATGTAESSATTSADAALPAPGERLSSLDTLRGFALLGILLMNIVGFAFHHEAYDNPTTAGGATGWNLWIWYVLHVVAEGKMRCLFSLVFGASVVVLTSRNEGKPWAADLYYRRTLWLLVLGIAHSFLLWQGEILYGYALCSFALYPFRRMAPRGLIALASALVVYCSVYYSIQAWKTQGMIREGVAAEAKAARGVALSGEETGARDEWKAFRENRKPSPEALEKDAADWRGNPWEVLLARGKVVVLWTSIPWYHPWNMDVLSMMLFGMAMMKLGVLSGARSTRFYAILVFVGYGLAVPVLAYDGWGIVKSGFDPVVQSYSAAIYDAGRLAVACGHLGFLMLVCRLGWLRGLTGRLAAVGQMALTNYLTHSVVCAFLFTGYGLGLYGRLERYQVYLVVLALWVFQLGISPVWLRHFRFGPAEWAWRSLTHWKRQPMRIA